MSQHLYSTKIVRVHLTKSVPVDLLPLGNFTISSIAGHLVEPNGTVWLTANSTFWTRNDVLNR